MGMILVTAPVAVFWGRPTWALAAGRRGCWAATANSDI